MKFFLLFIMFINANKASAQYLHYYDDSHKKAAVAAPLQPTTAVVYHEWPDKCPGISGSIPVLSSYVPHEMVLKLTEIYKGHLYTIIPLKNADNKTEYKLKVCVRGVMKFEYADESGTIVRRE